MIRWNNDYNHGAHPAVLAALLETNDRAFAGYGLDECCEQAAATVRRLIEQEGAEVHFLVGGTQANFTVVAAALRPYQGVISADSGHLHTHETGALERLGHKIHALPGTDGKLTAAQIEAEAKAFHESDLQEHVTEPKLVYLSFPTEFGTIYSKAELSAIRAVCDRYGLLLFLDGARLGYGLGAKDCDLTLPDLAALADAFTIGGTKCGLLMGEAAVLLHEAFRTRFRSYIKQNGAMLAKGFLLGLQFETVLRDGLYFDITRRAVEAAVEIKAAFAKKGVPLFLESPTNQQFVLLTEGQMAALGARHIFELSHSVGGDLSCVRFCTSWSTRPEDVAALIADIAAL